MRVYEFVDGRGRGTFSDWYADREKKERAALDAKLDAVRGAGESARGTRGELPPNMFRGPIRFGNKTYPNTFKFTVNSGKVAMRPLACRGPFDPANEWTILYPVIEAGNKYPAGCFAEAESRRLIVLADATRRRELLKDDDD